VPPATASACSAHRGLLVAIIRPAAAPAPTRAASAPTAVAAASAPAAPPAGSTMRCKDGTYLGGTPFAAACAGHGGLAAVLPAARQALPAAAGPRRP